jgi:hypothetical protein
MSLRLLSYGALLLPLVGGCGEPPPVSMCVEGQGCRGSSGCAGSIRCATEGTPVCECSSVPTDGGGSTDAGSVACERRWIGELVAAASHETQATSVGVDGAGAIYIGYSVETAGVFLAERPGAGGAWTAQHVFDGEARGEHFIAVSPTGVVHLLYKPSSLRYAVRDAAGAWTSTTSAIDSSIGRAYALALDAAGEPHVTYSHRLCAEFSCYPDTLFHAVLTDGSWATETIDTYRDGASLAIDASGTVHTVAPGEGTDSGVVFYAAKAPGAEFQPSLRLSGYSHCDDTAIALDSAQRAHVAFVQDGTLMWAVGGPDGFSGNDEVGPAQCVVDMAIDPDDGLHLVFIGPEGIEHAMRGALDDAWARETIEPAQSGVVLGGTSLAIDASGVLHLSYFRNDTTLLTSEIHYERAGCQ